MRIVVGCDLKDVTINVRKVGDRILIIKFVLGKELLHVINVYAPQVGSNKETKRQISNSLDELVLEISPTDKVFVSEDLNEHVEKDKSMHERVCGEHDFGNRNYMGVIVLDFALINNILISGYFNIRDKNI